MEAVVKGCREYELRKVMRVLEEALSDLGGIERFCKKGEKVLLKVNLLLGKDPKKAVTTHPVVVEAITRILQDVGCQVIIGDSPGGPFTPRRLRRIYQAAGLIRVAEETGACLNYECGSYKHTLSQGEVIKQVLLGDYIKDVHRVINLPKLKTHSFTGMTAGVKNLLGAVPGLEKIEFHLRFQDVETFSRFLVDLALAIGPTLNILDAITSMEGPGPSAGTPKETGFLILSKDPFLLDLMAGRLLGFDDSFVTTNRVILERNLVPDWEERKGDIELENLRLSDFKKPSSMTNMHEGSFIKRLPFHLGPALVEYLRPRPRFQLSSCKSCGDCEESCPPSAITMVDRYPTLEKKKCISCFCCQELCPHEAIEIKRSFLGRCLFKG